MSTGFMYAIGAAITWGLVYTIDQKILSNVSPLALLLVDAVITIVIVLPFVFFNLESIKSLLGTGSSNLFLVVISVLLAILASYLIFVAIKSLGAGPSSIIEIAYPFFVVLFSYLFYRSTLDLPFYIGGLFIFIGSAIIAYFH